ncbi:MULTISPECIES: DUF4270 family protein [Chryseobacterium]|uniref:DUF4270 domain-containing protein n=1 Tax=Chryseobacterium camelliae TaxID=1265445 RepID=A0ABU0TDZ7_9FLAO|nr:MULTISPECIES: DUF4270 family protein [Chryseobacterium]MDT3407153.1 hypothetical protein [Pseudacidovorax intermedius]MDQ1095056.1 hypothetical protein [Chryseobacterium camelliae]MDQ1098995.1 hypothetical protein [Chryseobacterium sp. SORGH_AS_1048]MDR6086343.1 hypothetical protein [Chryseobacterium sp. SORGH_AS_0909]MDR6130715.1 hypothetical protein [Chryseobacterium sp. SORGH_AS_1175]
MTHTIKKAFAVLFMAILGSVLLYNCEPDPDTLGEQLFLDQAAQGKEKIHNITAFNIINNDSIRSDAAKLDSAVLGAFKEDQFGMQRASYLTQLRLSTYNPDFGANAVVDSVVLVIKPQYAADSVKTTTNEDYIYPDGNVAAKKVVNTYPVRKFGKAKRTLNIKVYEVLDFLKGASDSVKSNQVFAYNTTNIGSKTFDGNINSVTITKDSDNSSIFTSSAPGIRINLDKTLFQNKIIAKKGQPELQDASNFIRHFRGLRIAVDENDGYLFKFSPNSMELIMYYKYDKTDNGTTTRTSANYSFVLGSGNAHIGQYEYDRTNTAYSSASLGNMVTGDSKLFAQGMGGPSIGIKIPGETIDSLKQLYQNNKAAIISAKIRLYTDAVSWNNSYAKPRNLTFLQKDKDSNGKMTSSFTTDALNLAAAPNFRIYKLYNMDKNPAYYEFTVTKSVKDIVEGGTSNQYKYFRIDIGRFLSNAANTGLAGQSYTSRAYAVSRAVFVGSNTANPNKAQLRVICGTK